MKRLPSAAVIPSELYVEREADRQLAEVIEQMGRPPYILVSRQMGKTNLLIHARRKLESDATKFAYVDLSNKPTSARDCFRRIIDNVLLAHPEYYRQAADQILNERKGADRIAHREFEAELSALLSTSAARLVIALDEIDALVNAAFCDEVFAQIRSIYFSRTSFPLLERVTFVLSGVAEPSDLIRDPKRSPFNIGEKIYLRDFSEDEISALCEKAELSLPTSILRRIYEWSGGHPRITWDVLAKVQDAERTQPVAEADVDRIVRQLYLTSYDVAPIDHIRDLVRTDTELRGALRTLHKGVVSNIPDWVRRRLYLAGVIKIDELTAGFEIKNRIFREALSADWINEIESRSGVLPTKAVEQLQLGNYEEAILLFKEFLKTGADLTDETKNIIQLEIAECLRRLTRFDEALVQFQALRFNRELAPSNFYRAKFLLGLAHFQSSDFKTAASVFEDIVTNYKRSLLRCKALINLGATLLKQEEEHDEQKIGELFQHALKDLGTVDLEDIQEISDLRLVAHYNLANLRDAGGDKAGAIEAYREAIKIAPPIYRPALFVELSRCVDADTERQRVLEEAVSYLSANRVVFSASNAFSAHERPIDLRTYSSPVFLDLWFELSRVESRVSLCEAFLLASRDAGILPSSSNAEVLLAMVRQESRSRPQQQLERTLQTALSMLQKQPERGASVHKDVLAWIIRLKLTAKQPYMEELATFLLLLEQALSLTETDISIFLQVLVRYRQSNEYEHMLRVCASYEQLLRRNVGEGQKFGFLVFYMKAQASHLLGRKTQAYHSAYFSLERLKTWTSADTDSILPAKTIESVRESAAHILEECSEARVSSPGVGRNEPCPCGSGKKYKNCHGK